MRSDTNLTQHSEKQWQVAVTSGQRTTWLTTTFGTEATASAGIERASKERPEIVIMDYSLPDLDGASATKLLKAKYPDMAVIMLTGSNMPGSYSAAIDAGCQAWIRKTRASSDLSDAIHRVAAGEYVRAEKYEELPALRELAVYYQPVLELRERRLVGFEALVRWQHPLHGLLLPARFLPIAEATGYVVDIGRHVADEAARALREFQRINSATTPLWMSINVSAVGLSRPNILGEFDALLAKAGIDPATLVLEITETALLTESRDRHQYARPEGAWDAPLPG
jgi:CheY-like chemotaxis protein